MLHNNPYFNVYSKLFIPAKLDKYCAILLVVLIIAGFTLNSSVLAQNYAKPRDYSVCFTPGENCERLLISHIQHEKQQILVQAYTFTSKPIARALIAAKKRGVNILVIADKSNVGRRYSVLKKLQAVHIPVYIDYRPAIAHNKIFIFNDSELETGSYNFSWAATHRNAENMLFIRNRALVKRYQHYFYHRLSLCVPLARYTKSVAMHLSRKYSDET